MEYPSYTEELFYDKAGNRTRRIASGVEELYQYDPRNRLTAYTKGGVTTMFQYDRAGNLLADDKARYSYDAFNRTEKVETFDGHIQLNRYDAEGLRYEMEENGNLVQFIFNQDREAVTEEDNSGLNRLIRASELIAAHSSADSARTYYHYVSDEMGSTTHIVDEAGAVKNRYEYDAWGNITAQEEAVPNRFKFTGQQLDPVTQQYYLRARFYNPVIARFTQEDTYRGDGLNLYAYCANNPVYYTDPNGYAAKAICKKKADSYYEIIENGGKLTLEQREELKRYERLKNNDSYKYEAEHGVTPYEAYKKVHPEKVDAGPLPDVPDSVPSQTVDYTPIKPPSGTPEVPEGTITAGKPGSPEWRAAVKALREAQGKGNNFVVDTEAQARQLIGAGRKELPEHPTYSHSKEPGFENHPPEPDVGNYLPHLKWEDWSKGKKYGANGHIYYRES